MHSLLKDTIQMLPQSAITSCNVEWNVQSATPHKPSACGTGQSQLYCTRLKVQYKFKTKRLWLHSTPNAHVCVSLLIHNHQKHPAIFPKLEKLHSGEILPATSVLSVSFQFHFPASQTKRHLRFTLTLPLHRDNKSTTVHLYVGCRESLLYSSCKT